MPLFWLALAFLSGIGLAAALPLSPWVWGSLSLISTAGLIWPTLRHRLRVTYLPLPLLALPLATGLGGLRYSLNAIPTNTTPNLSAWQNQGQITLKGWVCAPPDRRERVILLTVCAEYLEAPEDSVQAIRGRVLVTLWPFQTWTYGQRLELYGTLSLPEEGEAFSYRAYLERRGIQSQMIYPLAHTLPGKRGNPLMAGLEALRQRAYALVNRFYPQPDAALVSGILLGLDEDFPPTLERAYQITGTAHIIAISGFNMTLLSGALLAVLARFLPLGSASFFSLLVMGLYALLVGGEPAVLRAALMSGLTLLARLVGRSSAALNALAFSAALLCLFNPTLPWEVSFQLSVMATLGLILYAEPLQSAFTRALTQHWHSPWAGRLAGAVGEYLLVTLAAQVTTLPVLLAHFRRFSLSLLLANPLILPVQPALMVLGGLSLLVGLLAPTLGQALASLTWPLVAYTNRVVLALSQNALASLTLPPFDIGSVVLYYAIVLGVTLAWQRTTWRPALRGGMLIGALGLLTSLAWNNVFYRPDGKLHLVLFNVPASQAVLIRAPGGQTLLLDGAPSANALDAELGQYLPFLGRHLDGLILTSPRATPLEGLGLTLQRYEMGQAYWAIASTMTRTHARLERALNTAGIPQQPLSSAQILTLPPDLTLEVLPAEQGQTPLLIHYGELDLLIAGEIWPTETLSNLEARGLSLDGLILRGEGAAIPAAETPGLGLLLGQPAQPLPSGWLATGLHGTLVLTSDGQSLHLARR